MRKTIKCRYKRIAEKDKECLIEQFKSACKLKNTVLYDIKRAWNYDKLHKWEKWIKKKLTTNHRKVRTNYKNNMHYKQLNSHVWQEIIKWACQDFKSFFAKVKKDWRANIPKINKHKAPPLLFSKNISLRKLKDWRIVISIPNALKAQYWTSIELLFPPHLSWNKVKCVMVYLKKNTIIYTIIYEDWISPIKNNKDWIMSIDLWITNIASIVSLKNYKWWIYRTWKILHKLNCLHYLIDKEKNKYKKYLLFQKRNNMMRDYMHRLSNEIIRIAEENEIWLLIVWKNKNWKNEVNIGKWNNRIFYSLPHAKLFEYLLYKWEQKWIKVVEQEESYTSKCSFLDQETIKKHKNYVWTRVKRWLFKTKDWLTLHSDINWALNIAKKYMLKNAIRNVYTSKKWLSYPTKLTLH